MRAQEHDGDPQQLEDLDGGLRVVVAGAVEQDHGLLSPVGVMLVELLDQRHEVDLHDLRVAVHLCQRHVGVAAGVDAHDHRDPGRHDHGRHRVARALLSPLHPPEVGHPKPGLIDVQERVAGLPHLDELEGPLLPEDDVLAGVHMERGLEDLPVAHAHRLAHHLPDVPGFDVYIDLFLDAFTDTLS